VNCRELVLKVCSGRCTKGGADRPVFCSFASLFSNIPYNPSKKAPIHPKEKACSARASPDVNKEQRPIPMVVGMLSIIFDEESEWEAKRQFDLFVVQSKAQSAENADQS
jgi:hypothetical protein